MLDISALYIGVAALLYIGLAARIVTQRHASKTALGDGGDKELQKRIRAHGNFSEYAPLLLLMLAAIELQGAPAFAIHIFGILIIASRMAHAWFISQTPEPIAMRQLTMGVTFFVLMTMALGLFGHAIF